MQRFCFRTGVLFAGLFLLATCALAQNEPADPQVEQNLRPARSMILQQTQYQLRAGERISISAPQETIDFVRGAKARTVTINGAKGKGIAFGPTPRGDGMVLATSLTAQPGPPVRAGPDQRRVPGKGCLELHDLVLQPDGRGHGPLGQYTGTAHRAWPRCG